MSISLKGITKRFGKFTALDGVQLHAEPGCIHAIVGENGAGKTTLMRILYGAIRPDEGSLDIDGQTVQFSSTSEAIAHEIGMVSQHYAIIPELTCLQNLMLGAEPGAILNQKSAQIRAEELAEKMGFRFNWNADAYTLGPGDAQKLEILKLLWRRARIMILDEPTAMLAPRDADELFSSLTDLANQGHPILLVTHRLPEVLDYCRNVTVLRGGKCMANRPVAGLQREELAELIVGHQVAEFPRRPAITNPAILEVSHLTVIGDRGDEAVKAANFEIKQGELVGIAGVDGNGQSELFHSLMGVRKAKQGEVKLQALPLTHLNTQHRLAAGVRLIAEDRYAEAMIADWSLEENAVLGYHRFKEFRKGPGLDNPFVTDQTGKFAAKFDTKFSSLTQPLGALSGGNQQRFIAARALYGDAKLILAFQPARGLDIEATREVYEGIRESCALGAGALIVSLDVEELQTFCDRIYVMNRGVLREAKTKDLAEIGPMMVD